MKIFFSFILVITFIFKFYSSVISQPSGISNLQKNASDRLVNPLYEMRVSNFQTGGSSPRGSSSLFFDIEIYHTNLPDSGPFEFSAGEYYFRFNPGVAHGGDLTFSIVPNSTEFTNPNAVPLNPSIDGNILKLERNVVLGPGNGPIVSPVFPGTRVVTLKLETTAPSIDFLNLNLRWRDASFGEPSTKTFAYIDTVSTNITENGTLVIDETLLPVELTSFTSNILRNNVVLNWSTATETNNSGFDIERSIVNGQSSNEWTKIGNVAGIGTSTTGTSYSFSDKNLASGKYNYRLKQIDFNGNFEYFNLSIEVGIGIPVMFSLVQNYPNPFNPSTSINYDLPVDGKVSIRLFDMSGKEVATLVNEVKKAGYYSVNFNASSLSSGVYFYSISANNYTATKKMLLVK